MSSDAVIRAELVRAARALGAPDDVEPVLERPRDPSHGDWATNLAMTLSKALKRKPADIAAALIAELRLTDAGVSEATVAGPGFINFRIAAGSLASGLANVIAHGATYGRSIEQRPDKVVVEFVSANPTGPLHVSHGRQAALGDAISALLEHTGWSVTREFYYNDGGVQINNLALSVQARLRELAGAPLEIPEGGYHGEYIAEIARTYAAGNPVDPTGENLDTVRVHAVKALRHEQDLDLKAFVSIATVSSTLPSV